MAGFDVQGFSLGNLTPKYVPMGLQKSNNTGITAFSIRRNPEHLDQLQAFIRAENFGSQEVRKGKSLSRWKMVE